MIESLPLKKLLLMVYCLLCVSSLAWAENDQYQVEINAPSAIKSLLQTHLDMMKWRDNPRISPAEWQRLYAIAPQNIKELLATEAYFSPSIQSTLTHENNVHLAKFSVEVGQPAIVEQVDIRFTGDITTQQQGTAPFAAHLRGHRLRGDLIARVVDGDVPAGARGLDRGGGADAAAAAGDEQDSVHAPMLGRGGLG